MSNLAIQMTQFPDAFAQLADDPTLMMGAVEEVVRYASPIMYFRRTATKDTELAGTKIKKGEKVVMWYASGNFDEQFYENPMDFNISRPRQPQHLGYGGGGVHTCLGSGLARIELRALLQEILQRNIHINLTEAPVYVHSNFVNGVEELNVKLSSSSS